MRKLILVSAALASVLFLQGCNPIAERFHAVFFDNKASEQTRLEKSEFKPIPLDTIFLPRESNTSAAGQEQGYLSLEQVYAVDGDTIKAVAKKSDLEAFNIDTSSMSGTSNSVSVTIRYLLIDTPESAHPTKPKQPFSKEAKNRNSELLYSGNVRIMFDKGAKIDKYDRLLAYAYIGDTMIQEVLLKEGYARIAYVEARNTTHLKMLQKAEEAAKAQKIKVWSIPGYVTDRGFIEE